MMASLDLNQSHHAYLKFKPIAKQAPKRPEKKTFVPSNKAANWSALAAVEGEFQGEQFSQVQTVFFFFLFSFICF